MRLEIEIWQGRGATFRVGNSQNNSKEVLGMAKWFSAKETMAQRCQIRKGGSKAETAVVLEGEVCGTRVPDGSVGETTVRADKECRGISAKASKGAVESSRENAPERCRSDSANGGCSQRCRVDNGHSDGSPNCRANPGRPKCTSAVCGLSAKKGDRVFRRRCTT